MGNGEQAGCTPSCELAKCGDGLVLLGVEECDDGLDNSDDGACTSECKEARCGDGLTYAGVEECDHGDTPTEDDEVINDDAAYGGCTTGCKWGPHCGDGIVQKEEEECDDGEMPDPAKCSKECTTLTRVIFATSALYDGELGGIEDGALECQALAQAAGLGHAETFRAWLSGGGSSPLDWPVDPMNRYQLPSGMIVAKNWSQLVSGALDVPVTQTEKAAAIGDGDVVTVWTGTLADGSAAPWTCNAWEPNDVLNTGRQGLLTEDNGLWTDFTDANCSWSARLYCVEVW
jgi:cysteine-rich repeat protein